MSVQIVAHRMLAAILTVLVGRLLRYRLARLPWPVLTPPGVCGGAQRVG